MELSNVTSAATLPAEARGSSLTIYGSSSSAIDEVYKSQARAIGRMAAQSGIPLVSGGGRAGLMGAAIDGATEAGGETIGVLPAFMIERGWAHPSLTHTISVPDMHTRKALMAALAANVIALPGGIGTFEELFEIMTWRQLGLFKGGLVILDSAGYYGPMLDMLAQAADQGFLRRPGAESDPLYRVASNAEEAMALIGACPCS